MHLHTVVLYSVYSVRSSISEKHQVFCPAVTSEIIIYLPTFAIIKLKLLCPTCALASKVELFTVDSIIMFTRIFGRVLSPVLLP